MGDVKANLVHNIQNIAYSVSGSVTFMYKFSSLTSGRRVCSSANKLSLPFLATQLSSDDGTVTEQAQAAASCFRLKLHELFEILSEVSLSLR